VGAPAPKSGIRPKLWLIVGIFACCLGISGVVPALMIDGRKHPAMVWPLMLGSFSIIGGLTSLTVSAYAAVHSALTPRGRSLVYRVAIGGFGLVFAIVAVCLLVLREYAGAISTGAIATGCIYVGAILGRNPVVQ
jgi:hypothetical protein